MKKNIFDSSPIYISEAVTSLLHATSCRSRGQTTAPNLRLNKRDARFYRGRITHCGEGPQ